MGSIKIKGATSGSMVLTVPNTGSDNVPVNVDAINSITGKNLFINGGFDVWQRGTSFVDSGTGYKADRINIINYSGATHTVTKVYGPADFQNAMRITGVSAGQIEVETRFEATSLPQTGSVTLSYWIRGSKTGNIRTGRIINSTGGAHTTNTGFEHKEVTPTWQRISVTVSTLASSGTGVYRLFILDDIGGYLSSGSQWIEITGIQLEVGSVATNFEHRSYGEELALCQRYYYKEQGRNIHANPWTTDTSNWRAADFSFPVTMARAPDLAYLTATNWTGGYPNLTQTTKNGFHMNGNATNTHGAYISGYTANAELY